MNNKKCFACGEGLPTNDKQRVQQYKDMSMATGVNYVFYRNEENKIVITNAKNFKPKEGVEYALVTEYGEKPTEILNFETINEQEENNENTSEENTQIQQLGDVPDSGVLENSKQGKRTSKRNKSK